MQIMRCIAQLCDYLYNTIESDLHQGTWHVSQNEAHLDSRKFGEKDVSLSSSHF
ncbi:hypothetical protein CAter282_3455 [Collimonas arenae]|uniref:Uncharacterized protein n=1 Tax=Collimonas arenae TaxID=279058 RepID=A0A127QM78_9BURK|nr:hypothetical protein CAter282_3455 [Collimonas arenae]